MACSITTLARLNLAARGHNARHSLFLHVLPTTTRITRHPFAPARSITTAAIKDALKQEAYVLKAGLKYLAVQMSELLGGQMRNIFRDEKLQQEAAQQPSAYTLIEDRKIWMTAADKRARRRAISDSLLGIPWAVFLSIVPGSLIVLYLAARYSPWTLPSVFAVARGEYARTGGLPSAPLKGAGVSVHNRLVNTPWLTHPIPPILVNILNRTPAVSSGDAEQNLLSLLNPEELSELCTRVNQLEAVPVLISNCSDSVLATRALYLYFRKLAQQDRLLLMEMDGKLGLWSPRDKPSEEVVDKDLDLRGLAVATKTGNHLEKLRLIEAWVTVDQTFPRGLLYLYFRATTTGR